MGGSLIFKKITVSFRCLEQIRIKEPAGSRCLKPLKEPPDFMKEPTVLCWFFGIKKFSRLEPELGTMKILYYVRAEQGVGL